MISPCKPPFPRPRPLEPRPKHKRLPERKRMTIAIGFWSNDGILLCADTQLSMSGGIKTYDGKVHTHIFHDSSKYRIVFGVAGTGDSDYITMAMGKMMGSFPRCENLEEVETEPEERWLAFFNKHIAPWAYFPRDDRPYVELLIAVSGTHVHHTLYHCVGTAFYRTSTKAIGTGILLADEMLNRYTFGNYNIEQLGRLGVYIMAKVKHSVDGCGGSTQFMALRKSGDFALSDKGDVDSLEEEILAVERADDKNLVASILEKPFLIHWFSQIRKKKASKPSAQPQRLAE